ncbi:hypothetical protein [Roseibium marinum]|uniref:Uncharacterized protein n=1 Tax=Roseibium marinum TaxID=281252 RepID=A0A2S3V414_9HYPH|nr:hypothetical protein [Roseibium marinum]POF34513.1 hypothetical protein CLV41_101969 [Roseibium marinum]
MFQRLGGRTRNVAHLERIETAVRKHFSLAENDLVLVSEENLRVPGFPACCTLVRFWKGPERRYRIRIFEPVSRVSETDLPVTWLLPSLTDDGEPDCC